MNDKEATPIECFEQAPPEAASAQQVPEGQTSGRRPVQGPGKDQGDPHPAPTVRQEDTSGDALAERLNTVLRRIGFVPDATTLNSSRPF